MIPRRNKTGVLRKISGSMMRDELTGGWRKLTDEELHNLYYPPSIIKMNSKIMGR
jgi:hypothetical protein